MIRTVLVLTAAAFLAGPADQQPTSANTPVKTPVAQTEGEKLRALFRDSDEATLKRNPLSAIFRGDLRYADRLGDYCSDAYFKAEEAALRSDLAALAKIDR